MITAFKKIKTALKIIPIYVVVILFLLSPVQVLPATTLKRVRTAQELKVATGSAIPLVYVKGNTVRFYYTYENTNLVFKASWKKSKIYGRDFTQYIAELKQEKFAPDLSSKDRGWRQALVFDRTAWTNVVKEVAELLTPEEPWSGIYFNFLFQDVVLYRDGAGNIHATRADSRPPQTKIVKRYGVREFSKLATDVIVEHLKHYQTNQVFLFIEGIRERPSRFLLIDPANQYCVSLYAPHTGQNPADPLQIDYSLRVLTSLTIESHLYSIVKNPISSATRLINTAVQLTAGLLHVRLPKLSSDIPPVKNDPPMDLVDWENWLDKMTRRKAHPCQVRFLIDGNEFYPVLFQNLLNATNKIQIRIPIFDNDDIAVEIADLLKKKSHQTKVDVLIDLLSTQTSSQSLPETPLPENFTPPKSIRAYLQKDSKVHVRSFLNTWFTSDHSKLIIIDGKTAYIGGMNIGREYRYEWHDMMVELKGSIVSELQREFNKAWLHASLFGDCACLFSFLANSEKPSEQSLIAPSSKPLVRTLYTKTADLEIRKALFEAVARARNHIYIENSYLFDSSFASAIVKARRRGVDVRVILPERCDTPGGNSSIYVTANYLLNNGVRVYIYPGMTHIKSIIIDNWACLGSANFNRLSLTRNQEINIATSDPGIVSELKKRLFDVDFARSFELDSPVEVNWTDHIAESILNQF